MKTFWKWGLSCLLLIAVIGLFACGMEQDRGESKETSNPTREDGAVIDEMPETSKEPESEEPQSPSDSESRTEPTEPTGTQEPTETAEDPESVTTDFGWIPGWY